MCLKSVLSLTPRSNHLAKPSESGSSPHLACCPLGPQPPLSLRPPRSPNWSGCPHHSSKGPVSDQSAEGLQTLRISLGMKSRARSAPKAPPSAPTCPLSSGPSPLALQPLPPQPLAWALALPSAGRHAALTRNLLSPTPVPSNPLPHAPLPFHCSTPLANLTNHMFENLSPSWSLCAPQHQ